jgi:hypothetical protein
LEFLIARCTIFFVVFSLEEEITFESLLTMSDEVLAKIIPKAGPRSLLMHTVREVV